MLTLIGISLIAAGVVSTSPPDISGNWQGEDWGQVTLTQTAPGEYAGTYTDTVTKKKGQGKIDLKWSRIERRFNGTWREGESDRFGDLSIRLMDNEIRGALTTDPKSKINPATPRLADLVWRRVDKYAGDAVKPIPPEALAAFRDWRDLLKGKTTREMGDPDFASEVDARKQRYIALIKGTLAEPLWERVERLDRDGARALAREDGAWLTRVQKEADDLRPRFMLLLGEKPDAIPEAQGAPRTAPPPSAANTPHPRAVQFDGNHYAKVEPPPKFTAGDFTISLWFNKLRDNRDEFLFDRQMVRQVQPGDFGIGVDDQAGRFDVVARTADRGWLLEGRSFGPILFGQWNHVVVTRHDDVYTMWINGAKVGSEKSSAGISDVNNTNPFIIGGTMGRNGVRKWDIFHGSLDDFRIFRRCLSEQEIADLYKGNGDENCLPGEGRVPIGPLLAAGVHEKVPTVDAVQWSEAIAGNGHWYEVVSAPGGITWTDAKRAAEAKGGYLATITSAKENAFVYSLVDNDRFWHLTGNNDDGPWLGGIYDRETKTWSWGTGEPWNYSNWFPGQPDHLSFPDRSFPQDRFHFYGGAYKRAPTWGDNWHDCANPSAYVVEWNSRPDSSAVQHQTNALIPPILPPGSRYQLLLITGGSIQATSSDIKVYNDFAAAQITNPALTSLGVSWKALVSTPSVSARKNAPTSTLPIYNTRGQVIALNSSDLWDSSISAFILDQYGQSDQRLAWTGTSPSGESDGPWSLGGGAGYSSVGPHVAVVGGGAGGGGRGTLDWNWVAEGLIAWTDRLPVFALSTPITVLTREKDKAQETVPPHHRAIQFDGNHYAKLPQPPKFTAGDFTISLWFNPTPADKSKMLFHRGFSYGDQPGDIDMHLNVYSGELDFQARTTDNEWLFGWDIPESRLHSPVRHNQWNHVVATRRGDAYTMWINGARVGSEKSSADISDAGNTNPFLVGGIMADDGARDMFNGQLDDFRIFHRCLSDKEVAELYKSDGNETFLRGEGRVKLGQLVGGRK